MYTKILILLFIISAILNNLTINTANAVLPSYKIDAISIEGTDFDGEPSGDEYSIRGVRVWLEGQIDENDDEYLGNLVVRRSNGTEIVVKRGSLVGLEPGHDLRGTQGTTVNSSNEIRTNSDGEFYLSFILPFNAVANTNDTLYIYFTETADGQYDRVRDTKNQFVKFDVQVPRYSDADMDDKVYRNGDLIDIDLELETDISWPGVSAGRGIEVLTLLPDFSNVDSRFAGGNSPTVPIGKQPNNTIGRYDLTKWDTSNTNPNALDLYDLSLDVKRAIQEGRLIITEDGRGDYNVRYVISTTNVNDPGRKRVFVYAIDFPSVLIAGGLYDIFKARDIFNAIGLPFPAALNIAKWKTTDDLNNNGSPDTADINLDQRAPDFDFAIINPFVNPPCVRWSDVDGDGQVDPDEWVYVYKQCDVVSVMVSIDPHDLIDEELEEIDPDQIFPDGNEDVTIRNITVIGDISSLLDPYKVDLTTDANSNNIPDAAEVMAIYAGYDGKDDDFDGAYDNANDEEDKTPNGFDERFLFIINFPITDGFKITSDPMSIRFLIQDMAGNISNYSAWREELYILNPRKWRTIPISNWGRDNGLVEPGVLEPVYVDGVFYPDGNSLWGSAFQYPPTPDRAKMPQWSRGYNVLQYWDQPWRIQIDYSAPSSSIFSKLLLEVPPAEPVNGPVPPLTAGGKSVLETGNFIYEIGGSGLVTLQATFPSDNDVDYVMFMYSDTGITFSPMKGYYVGDVNISGFYDMLGDQRDPNFPGAGEGLWHDGLNGDDDRDRNADFNDSQVYNAVYKTKIDGIDNDADGLVDANDAEIYTAARDDDEDGIMDEDEYVVKVVNGVATWSFDPLRMARILKLSPDKAYAIKAVAFDCAGNAKEEKASPIYVIFRVIGEGVQQISGTATAEIYQNGQPVTGMALLENYTYDIVATTTGTVNVVAFQYSMDKRIWVNIPMASGEPNPDSTAPFRISWLPTLAQLAADLWIDGNSNGIKDPDEPVYELGDELFIRAVAYSFNPILGMYLVVSGLTIYPQTYIPYTPQVLTPSPSSQEITTGVSDKPSIILNLKPGWNLISICLKLSDYEIIPVILPIINLCRSIYTYDASTQKWLSYIPGHLNNSLTSFDPKKSYWIDMSGGANLIIKGTELENTDVSLHQGWNMAGYCSTRTQPVQNAMDSIAGKNFSIWTYDTLSEEWLKYSPNVPVFLNSLDQLVPGKGYVIEIDEESVWTVLP